jgi:hypothetical protein
VIDQKPLTGRHFLEGHGIALIGAVQPLALYVEVLVKVASLARAIDEGVRLRHRGPRVIVGAELGAIDHRGPVVGQGHADLLHLRQTRLNDPSCRLGVGPARGAAMSEQSRRARANLIAIRIENISQLFHSLDPLPFREKNLDKDAEEFIVSWARELPADQPIKIVVHLPEEQLTLPEAQDVGPAVKQFFAYRAQVIGLELKEMFRIGRPSLAIGLTVLILSPLGKVLGRESAHLRLGRELAADRNLSL